MKFALLILIGCLSMQAAVASFAVEKTESGSWARILGSVGIVASQPTQASIIIAGEGAGEDASRFAENHILVLIGNSAAAAKLGIQDAGDALSIRQICDAHAPKVQIIWEHAVDTHAAKVPMDFQVFATERWKGRPVLAGKKTAHGAVLWMATQPGPSGLERYPYVLQALSDLGLELPAQTTNLWAYLRFFVSHPGGFRLSGGALA